MLTTHAVPQLVQVLSEITLILFRTDIVDIHTAFALSHLHQDINYQPFVDCKRFCDLILHHTNNIKLVVQYKYTEQLNYLL